jgi:hypothetical protein
MNGWARGRMCNVHKVQNVVLYWGPLLIAEFTWALSYLVLPLLPNLPLRPTHAQQLHQTRVLHLNAHTATPWSTHYRLYQEDTPPPQTWLTAAEVTAPLAQPGACHWGLCAED